MSLTSTPTSANGSASFMERVKKPLTVHSYHHWSCYSASGSSLYLCLVVSRLFDFLSLVEVPVVGLGIPGLGPELDNIWVGHFVHGFSAINGEEKKMWIAIKFIKSGYTVTQVTCGWAKTVIKKGWPSIWAGTMCRRRKLLIIWSRLNYFSRKKFESNEKKLDLEENIKLKHSHFEPC